MSALLANSENALVVLERTLAKAAEGRVKFREWSALGRVPPETIATGEAALDLFDEATRRLCAAIAEISTAQRAQNDAADKARAAMAVVFDAAEAVTGKSLAEDEPGEADECGCPACRARRELAAIVTGTRH